MSLTATKLTYYCLAKALPLLRLATGRWRSLEKTDKDNIDNKILTDRK